MRFATPITETNRVSTKGTVVLFYKSGVFCLLVLSTVFSIQSMAQETSKEDLLLKNSPLHVFELDQETHVAYKPASPASEPKSLAQRSREALTTADQLKHVARSIDSPFSDSQLDRLHRLFPNNKREGRIATLALGATEVRYPVDETTIKLIARGELKPETMLLQETEPEKVAFYEKLKSEIEYVRRFRGGLLSSDNITDRLLRNGFGVNELNFATIPPALIAGFNKGSYFSLVHSHLEHEAYQEARNEALEIVGSVENPVTKGATIAPDESVFDFVKRTQADAKSLSSHLDALADGFDEVATAAAADRVLALDNRRVGLLTRLKNWLAGHDTPETVTRKINNRATRTIGGLTKGLGLLGVATYGYDALKARKDARMPRISAQDAK